MMGRGPMMHGFGAFGPFGGFRDLQVAVPCRMVSGFRSPPRCRRAARSFRGNSSSRWDSMAVIILAVSVWVGAPRDGAARLALGRSRTARQ